MEVRNRAVARTASLLSDVSKSGVDGGDMETWKARAAARVSGTRVRDIVGIMLVSIDAPGTTRWLLKYGPGTSAGIIKSAGGI